MNAQTHIYILLGTTFALHSRRVHIRKNSEEEFETHVCRTVVHSNFPQLLLLPPQPLASPVLLTVWISVVALSSGLAWLFVHHGVVTRQQARGPNSGALDVP